MSNESEAGLRPDPAEAKGEELACAFGTARCPNRVTLAGQIAAVIRETERSAFRNAQAEIVRFAENARLLSDKTAWAAFCQAHSAIRLLANSSESPRPWSAALPDDPYAHNEVIQRMRAEFARGSPPKKDP